MARRLIINADDFGLTTGINRAIIESHREGLVTSATLMANAVATEEAIALARENPKLSVGCHVTLLDGVPILPATELPSLADPATQNFRHSLRKFAWAAMAGSVRGDVGTSAVYSEAIRREAEAQMRKLQSAGLRVSHLDTHKHVHIFPAVLSPIIAAARACGVRAIRNPFAPRVLPAAVFLPNPHLWGRYLATAALRLFARNFHSRVAEAGIASTRGILGVVATGALTPELFAKLIAALPSTEGTWEFVCHPGYNDAALDALPTRLRASREQELATLKSPAAQEAIERSGVEKVSYREL